MIGWLIFLIYVAGVIYTGRKTARFLLNDTFHSDDSADQFIGRFLGFAAGLLWPIFLTAMFTTGRLPKSAQQLQDELNERDRRIAELERELGITS